MHSSSFRGFAVVIIHGWSSPFSVMEGGHHLLEWALLIAGGLAVGRCHHLSLFCAVVHGCEGWVLLVFRVWLCPFLVVVGSGWSGCSSSLVAFCGLWVVVLCVIVVICGQLGFCLDGGQFMLFVGGHAHFVWWVVMVCGSLGWTSHIVSRSAVVVRGQSYSFCVVVGAGRGWVCSSSFVDFDRGQLWSFVGDCACFMSWWAVIICGWCSLLWVLKLCHKYRLGWGYKYPTHTCTHHYP